MAIWTIFGPNIVWDLKLHGPKAQVPLTPDCLVWATLTDEHFLTPLQQYEGDGDADTPTLCRFVSLLLMARPNDETAYTEEEQLRLRNCYTFTRQTGVHSADF
jgi:hypothetical protein